MLPIVETTYTIEMTRVSLSDGLVPGLFCPENLAAGTAGNAISTSTPWYRLHWKTSITFSAHYIVAYCQAAVSYNV